MSTITTYRLPVSIDELGFSVLNFFMVIGLLRLTNLNFYLSQLVGLETEINNTGGDAFNFVNYMAVAGLAVVVVSKISKLTVSWLTGRWIYLLLVIYLVNAISAPYVNSSWVTYQVLFLLVALTTHFLTLKIADDYIDRFERGLKVFFVFGIAFIFFVLAMILSQVSISSYIMEFNDSFVQSLDDFGIMKQRYGYFLGFVLSYAIFIEKKLGLRLLAIGLIFCTGFGIRSFLIGLVGAGFVFTVRKPKYFIAFTTIVILAFYILLSQYFEMFVESSRFYPVLNGLHIVENYPMGVGLGGYPVFTEENSKQLLGAFYDVRAVLDFIPTAPESDIVHLLGSLGFVLGGLHIMVQLRLVWFAYKLQHLMDPFHKCILFYFCYMTFFGISEDSIFSVNYWIFFGVASGIIAYLLAQRKKQLDA